MAAQVNRGYHIVLRLLVIPSEVDGRLLTALFLSPFCQLKENFAFYR